MLCCISSSSTVDDGITETSEERRQRIVPGFNRPESELDWEEITVFQWPNDNGSEGFQRPASTIGSQAAENIARQHQARLAALNNPAVRQSNDLSEVPPVNVSKKKKPGLFAKKSSKNRPAPGPPKEGERLPGDINRVPAPPPLPPGRDDLPHLTARRLTPQTTNNSTEQPNGQVHESTHRKAIPLHGNLQLNFSVPGRSVPDDVESVQSGTAADTADNRPRRNKSKADGSKRSKFSLKIKRPTFLSDSAFGTNKKTRKTRKSPKSYRAPDPPGFHPPSSIDTGITEDRLPLGDKMHFESRLDTIEEPQHWERAAINDDEDDLDRDRSPSERLVGKYDPKNYINKVPSQDASGNELPQWKRLLIAKQFAEKSLVDDEEQARKEEEERRFKDMPGWKRAILEKKEAENRAKREREQDLAALEWAKRNPGKSSALDERNPSTAMALDEDGLPMTPWQAELRERRDSKSSNSDNSRGPSIQGQ